MSRLLRKILLLVTLTAFILIAPVVVLYAIGYRTASIKGTAKPVGVLLVETSPKRANVSINGKDAGRTPQGVSNLPVGQVTLQLTKNGYLPWEKTLPIEPARATETGTVRLFPQDPTRTQLLPNITTFNLSPNRALIAALTRDNHLSIRSALGEEVSPDILLTSQPTQMLWSPDSTSILLEYRDKHFELVQISARRSLVVPLETLSGMRQVSWDARVPGRIFALDNKQNLIAFTIATNTGTTLISQVNHFAVSSRNIFVISQNDLKIYTLQGQPVSTLPLPANHTPANVFATPAGNLALLMSDSSLFFLGENNTFMPVAEKALQTAWSPDGNVLLIQTAPNELSVYNAADERRRSLPIGQLRLVTRLSRPIMHPQWFAGGNHFIYQVDDEITMTEIDTRDHPISYTVDTTNNGDANITVGEDGNIVYYLKTNPEDGTSSLSSTSLLTPADSK